MGKAPSVGILAGGKGSRFGAETARRPKPLLRIGDQPILWHIMANAGSHGFGRFVIATGYLGHEIRSWASTVVPGGWEIDLVETGESTGTGGRIRRLVPHLGERTFLLLYGDGLSDIDLTAMVGFHRDHGRLATIAVVHPRSPFGRLELDGDLVTSYEEKPVLESEWASAACFVLEPRVADYIASDEVDWEGDPLEGLAKDGELMAFRHGSFFHPMDTEADRRALEELWSSGAAPWKRWE